MKKLLVLIIGIIIAIIAVLLFTTYYSQIDPTNFSAGDGLTVGQKREAVSIALTSPDMSGKMLWIPGKFQLGPVSSMGSEWLNRTTGYTNLSGPIVQVPITWKGDLISTEHYLLFVDLSRHEVLGTEQTGHLIIGQVSVKIPQGSGWYHELMDDSPNGKDFTIGYDNTSKLIMPEIVDRDNLQKAIAGKAYRTVNVSLTVKPEQYLVSGSLQDSRELYMLINNNGTANTSIIVSFVPVFK